MSRRLKGKVKPFLLLGLLAACWCLSAWQLQKAMEYGNAVSLHYNEPALSSKQLEELLANNAGQENSNSHDSFGQQPSQLAFWKQQDKQPLTSEIPFPKSTAATVYTVYGNTELLLPAPLLSGALPGRGDTLGCAIDRATAHALWGSNDVIGKTIVYEKNTYQVRGVIDSETPVFMIQAALDDKPLFTVMTLRFSDQVNGLDAAQNFLQQQNLPFPAVTSNGSVIRFLAGLFAALPGLVAFAGVVLMLLRYVYSKRHVPLIGILSFFACAVIAAISYILMKLQIALPLFLIPGRWSNFSFWSDQFKSFISSFDSLLRNGLSMREIPAFWALIMGTLFCAMTLLLLVKLLRKKPAASAFSLYTACGWYAAIAFLVSLPLITATEPFAFSRTIWLSIPIVLALQFCIGMVQQKFFPVAVDYKPQPVLQDADQFALQVPAADLSIPSISKTTPNPAKGVFVSAIESQNKP